MRKYNKTNVLSVSPWREGFDSWSMRRSLDQNPYTTLDKIQENAEWVAGWRAAEKVDAPRIRVEGEHKG